MADEILEACARDELRGLGMDEDAAGEALAAMRDRGVFDVPDDAADARRQSDDQAWGGRGPSASHAEWLAEGREDGGDDEMMSP